jgi:hypothetical protein
MTISNCFNSLSPYYGAIPAPLLDAPLQNISFGDQGFVVNDSFTTTAMDQIATRACAPTISHITINYAIPDDTGGAGPFPANWAQLPALTYLFFFSCAYTVCPSQCNTLTHLTVLQFSNNGNLTDYGDLSSLVNLTTFSFGNCPKVPATLPAYLHLFTKLKAMSWTSCFMTDRPGTLDTFITNIYNLAVSMAPITGTSTDIWRSVTFGVAAINGLQSTTQVPSGTHQQPAGYVLGSSNGSPASSLEMIWVLEQQYKWICTWNQ